MSLGSSLTIMLEAVSTKLVGHTTDQGIIDGYNVWKESVGAVNITANDMAKAIKYACQLPKSVSLRKIIITDTMQDA